MLEKIIRRFIRPRHYWRDLGFDELSELYSSIMFRSLAMNLVGIFIPIYLYQLDFHIWQIFFFYAAMFSFWALSAYPVARIIAKVGPKHSMLASYVFLTMALTMLVSEGDLKWPLAAIAAIQGFGNALYFIAFHVDYSKVKHRKHGGKEIGWVTSMEKIGAILGPIVGGLIGHFWGKEYIFMVAIILMFTGLIPLFATKEPTAVNQVLKFRELKVNHIKYDLISHSFLNLENNISVMAWPLYMSIFIFVNDPYLKLGSVISISMMISLFMARLIGKTIDKDKGRLLLRSGASLNSMLHLFRPFASSYPFALGISMTNEVLTPSYRMPYVKGMYDAADDWPGRRIVYLTAMETVGAIGKATFCTLVGILAFLTADSKSIFFGIFIAGALFSLGIMLERFRALKPKR